MKKNTGVTLDVDTVARARAAITALKGTKHDPGSLSAMIDRLLEAEVTRLEEAHHGGKPFPVASVLPRGLRGDVGAVVTGWCDLHGERETNMRLVVDPAGQEIFRCGTTGQIVQARLID